MTRFDKILIVFFLFIVIACDKDNSSISEDDKLTEQFSSEYFDYYYSKSEKELIDTAWQEMYYDWLIGQLNINMIERLQYYKYRDTEHKKAVTGKSGNGFAEIGTYKFHTIWKVDNHECVHTIVTQIIGHPPALFNEGIAVAHQADYYKYPDFIPGWNGQDYNKLSKEFLENDEIPLLDNLLDVITFWHYNSNLTYPIAGSFTSYLIDNYGIQKLKDYISISNFEDEKTKIISDFHHVYEDDLEDVWQDWKGFLQDYE